MTPSSSKNPRPRFDPDHFTYHPLLQQIRQTQSPYPNLTELEWSWFQAHDGAKMFVRRWYQKDSARKAFVVVFHGMGGGAEFYVLIADQMVAKGFEVVAVDLYGHGLSEGPRGDIKNFRKLGFYIHEYLAQLSAQNPIIPIFFIAESMGATIVLNIMLDSPPISTLHGLILMNPAIQMRATNFSFKDGFRILGHLLINLFTIGRPTYRFRSPQDKIVIDGKELVNPLHFQYDLQSDQQFHFVSLRYLFQVNKAMSRALHESAKGVHVPLLIILGENDHLFDPQGAHTVFDQASIPDKTLISIPNAPHTMVDYPTFQKHWITLINWLESHLETK